MDWEKDHNFVGIDMVQLDTKRHFLCNLNPRDLVSSSIDALESLATQSKAQMKMNFFQMETATKSRLARMLAVPNQRRSQCVAFQAEDNSENRSTQFLQKQKNQFIDLQEHFE